MADDSTPWVDKSTSQLTAEEKLEAFRATGAIVNPQPQPGYVGTGKALPPERNKRLR